MESLKQVGNSYNEFVYDSGNEIIPNGVTRSKVINFAERVLRRYASHTENYDTYNAKRTDFEIRANKLFMSESRWFSVKNGRIIAVNDIQANADMYSSEKIMKSSWPTAIILHIF